MATIRCLVPNLTFMRCIMSPLANFCFPSAFPLQQPTQLMAFLLFRRMLSSSAFVQPLAVVTGGGSGIGRATCQILCRDGVSVVAADINEDHAKETISSLPSSGQLKHASFPIDVSQRSSVQEVFDKVIKEYGRPANIIVNCAGITRDAMMVKMTDEQLNQVLDVNIKGTFYPIQIGCKQMIEAKVPWGSIVTVSSTSGKYGNVGQTNYATSKEGIVGLTKSVAKEMAKYNIRCNAVVPGYIDTPMTKTIPEHIAQVTMMLIALKRSGKPEEVAEAIAFLSSEKASYITGATLDVTGGFLM